MKLKKIILCKMLILALASPAISQVSIDAELRPRTEFRHGYKKPMADTLSPAFVTFQRTRFNADYASKTLNARISMQDARIWGESTTKSNVSKIEIFEAWAEYFATPKLSLKVGRQILKYDDQRMFSASNWSNTGIAHDLLLLRYKASKTFEVQTAFAYNNPADVLVETNYTTSKMYKSMGLQWVSKIWSSGWKATFIGVEEGLQKTGDYTVIYPRITLGSNISFDNDSSKLGLGFSGYYQTGKSASFDDLNAFMVAVKLNYKICNKLSSNVGFDYFSGTKTDVETGTSGTFNKLYGSNHAFNGYMDYWTDIPKPGLTDIYIGLKGTIYKKLLGEITFHKFSLAQEYLIGTEKIEKDMGSELDFVVDWKVSKEFAVQGGTCMYFYSSGSEKYFKVAGIATKTPFWAYVMLTIKPNFYKTPSM